MSFVLIKELDLEDSRLNWFLFVVNVIKNGIRINRLFDWSHKIR